MFPSSCALSGSIPIYLACILELHQKYKLEIYPTTTKKKLWPKLYKKFSFRRCQDSLELQDIEKWQQMAGLKWHYIANVYRQVASNQNAHSVEYLQLVLMMLNRAGSKHKQNKRIIRTPQPTGGIVTGSYKNSLTITTQLTSNRFVRK